MDVLLENFLGQVSVIIGGPKKPKIEEDDTLQLVIYMSYSFLLVIVNMKLLISVIGETFAKYQISRVSITYNMKVNYLVEFSYVLNLMSDICRKS